MTSLRGLPSAQLSLRGLPSAQLSLRGQPSAQLSLRGLPSAQPSLRGLPSAQPSLRGLPSHRGSGSGHSSNPPCACALLCRRYSGVRSSPPCDDGRNPPPSPSQCIHLYADAAAPECSRRCSNRFSHRRRTRNACALSPGRDRACISGRRAPSRSKNHHACVRLRPQTDRKSVLPLSDSRHPCGDVRPRLPSGRRCTSGSLRSSCHHGHAACRSSSQRPRCKSACVFPSRNPPCADGLHSQTDRKSVLSPDSTHPCGCAPRFPAACRSAVSPNCSRHPCACASDAPPACR